MVETKKQSFNRCDLFLLGWVVYYLQGILYAEGGTLSIALLGILLLISLLYCIRTIQLNDLPVYFKGLNVLLLMFTVYGAIHIIMNPGEIHYKESDLILSSYEYLKTIWLSLLPIYPFYYFSRKGYFNEQKLNRWFFVFVLSCTLTFFRNQRDALLLGGLEQATNNSGYLMLSLLPGLVLFQRKNVIQFLLLAYILAFIFIGMKRGAIFIACICLPILLWRSFKLATKRQRFIFFTLAAILVYFGVTFVRYQMQTNEYIMLRILETEAGNSSGRDSLYGFFINYFFNQNSFFSFLFGNGADTTLNIYENYAHNDWLEIAINQGLAGVVIYLYYWILFFRTWRYSNKGYLRLGLSVLMVVFFMKTFFSMSYASMTYISTCMLGFFLAHRNDETSES